MLPTVDLYPTWAELGFRHRMRQAVSETADKGY